jgi:hypothetical protein
MNMFYVLAQEPVILLLNTIMSPILHHPFIKIQGLRFYIRGWYSIGHIIVIRGKITGSYGVGTGTQDADIEIIMRRPDAW